ncbi:MAG: hypothetical protein IPG59_12855 [Candidatus Melainabacteria bacterium]|nr:MAG: hypothetical protein IPG59_12855 [Candidatus Melainabacteria bacterium]
MNKIRASGIKSHAITAESGAKLSDELNAWLREATRAELVCLPQFAANQQGFSALILYTEMSEPLGDPQPDV